MNRLTENQYILNISKVQMKKIGFKYDHSIDDYTYTFPVYKYKEIPLIFCKLGVDEETQKLWFNVYDTNNVLYSPYYDRRYGHNIIISQIEQAVSKELTKLGAAKVN